LQTVLGIGPGRCGGGARRRGRALFQIQGWRGAAHKVGRNHQRRERGERELRSDLLCGTDCVVQGVDGREEKLCRGRGRGALPGRADAVRRLPSTARRIRADAKVFVADVRDLEKIREFTVQELLPSAFVIVP